MNRRRLLVLAVLWLRRRRVQRGFLSETDRITYETLRMGSQAGRHLRSGLTPEHAHRAARHLRQMLGASALAICDSQDLLVWSGHGDHHADQALQHAERVLRTPGPALRRSNRALNPRPARPARQALPPSWHAG